MSIVSNQVAQHAATEGFQRSAPRGGIGGAASWLAQQVAASQKPAQKEYIPDWNAPSGPTTDSAAGALGDEDAMAWLWR
jgi:hypothetical protein